MPITGNLAKYHIIQELDRAFAAEPSRTFHVLDVGVTGPVPWNLWEPLFKHTNFELEGIDIDGPSIEALKKSGLPKQVKRVEALSGYDLRKIYQPGSFDVVVSTQVLEHMRYPGRAIKAAFEVLKPGGIFYVCYDNGDYPRHHGMLKELVKDIVVRVSGSERYHDKDIPAVETVRMLKEAGFAVADQRFYNLHPLKYVHNIETPIEKRDGLIVEWKRFEDYLNATGHAAAHPERYLVAYFKAKK